MAKEYTSSPWKLDDLFPGIDSKEMNKAFKTLEAYADEFESWRDKLSPDMDFEDFMDLVEKQNENLCLINKMYQYAFLKFSEDTQQQDAQTFMTKVQQFSADLDNRTMFFSLWWKGLEDEAAERLMADTGDYKYYLQQLRNFKPHTLTEPEEKIINTKNVTGPQALKKLYESITNRYVFKIEVGGEEKELTQGELLPLIYGPDADLRKRAYQKLFEVYGADGTILGQIYQAFVRDFYNENVGMRKFKNTMAVRNLINDVPDEVVDALLKVGKKNAVVFQRYFKLKAKWLKVDKLSRYDIYAPVAASDKKYSFNEAAQMVFDAFREFDPKVAELAQQVLDEQHLDSEVRKGKMTNYTHTVRDVATLAHELGHSIHSMLASDHVFLTTHASLPLAETASTFGEMLLTDKLLAEEKDEGVRRDILFAQVDDNFATVQRQIFFALFEREAHQAIQENALVDDINEICMKNLEAQFGDSLGKIPEEFKWEWVYVAHFYDRPFYVYAYAFGQLLVLALYQQYKKEGKKFIPRYLEILKAGGSMAPIDILDQAGIDVRKEKFWQGGYDVISGRIDQLEAIPVE
jgi:oligoendopeptidase F